MTRLDALTSLRDAWRIGLWVPELLPNVPELHTDLTWKTFEGSTDAGLALRRDVLPGWTVVPSQNAHHRDWSAFVMFAIYGQIELESRANADDPARALLLAIIEALIAQEETK